MVVVTVAVGLASAMAVAMLSASGTRARVASNAVGAAAAHALAESGVNVAMYYLLYPDRYTGPKPNGHYPGEDPVPLGASAGGRVRTRVTYDSVAQTYRITSEAVAGGTGTSASRSIQAVIQVLQPTATQIDPIVDALVTNAPTTLNARFDITGDIKSLGGFTLAGATIKGKVGADLISLNTGATVTGQARSLATALIEADATATASTSAIDPATVRDGLTAIVPSPRQLPDLQTYAVVDLLGISVNYPAQALTADEYSGVTLSGSLITNPRAVYVINGDPEDVDDDSEDAESDDDASDKEDDDTRVVTIRGTVTINGSLIVRGARLRLAPGATLVLRPHAGFPALVSDGAITMGNGSGLAANGLVYAHRIVGENPSPAASLAINGALLLRAPTAPLPADLASSALIAYDKTRAQLPGFGTIRPPAFARGVRVIDWKE